MNNVMKTLVVLVSLLALTNQVTAIGPPGSTFGVGPTTLGAQNNGGSFASSATGVYGFYDQGGRYHPWTMESYTNWQMGNLPGIALGNPVGVDYTAGGYNPGFAYGGGFGIGTSSYSINGYTLGDGANSGFFSGGYAGR
jgi:hypothetical protein